MAAIDDLVAQVKDAQLRARLEAEVQKLREKRHFGLVFEEHLPECTPLYDVPIKAGCQAGSRVGEINVIYRVLDVKDGQAVCVPQLDDGGHGEVVTLPVDELVTVAKFGEPIYPYLEKLDQVENAPGDPLWHIVMEAENFHALQLLAYLYPHKCDCLYLDPPYNTGAKDWKYNNNYVDGNDQYRHSKWLSFMKHRLELAKRLLNPRDSVLIVTIDEKEYLHLGTLLEDMFPDAKIQMVSTIISHHGNSRVNEFSRVNEYIFILMFGNCDINPIEDTGYVIAGEPIHWQSFRRSNPSNVRASRPSQFYPIYINRETKKIEKVGDPITPDVDRFSVEQIDGCEAVFPVRDDGTEMMWSLLPDVCQSRIEKGYFRVGKYTPKKPQQFVLQYLMSGTIDEIEQGKISITGREKDGSIIAENKETKKMLPRTQWDFLSHDARSYPELFNEAHQCLNRPLSHQHC